MRASIGIAVAGQAVGVAGAVEALVVVADGRSRVAQRRDAAHDLLAERRVRAHDRPLLGRRAGPASRGSRCGIAALPTSCSQPPSRQRSTTSGRQPEALGGLRRRARRPARRGPRRALAQRRRRGQRARHADRLGLARRRRRRRRAATSETRLRPWRLAAYRQRSAASTSASRSVELAARADAADRDGQPQADAVGDDRRARRRRRAAARRAGELGVGADAAQQHARTPRRPSAPGSRPGRAPACSRRASSTSTASPTRWP